MFISICPNSGCRLLFHSSEDEMIQTRWILRWQSIDFPSSCRYCLLNRRLAHNLIIKRKCTAGRQTKCSEISNVRKIQISRLPIKPYWNTSGCVFGVGCSYCSLKRFGNCFWNTERVCNASHLELVKKFIFFFLIVPLKYLEKSLPLWKAGRDRDQSLYSERTVFDWSSVFAAFMGCIQTRSAPLWIQWGSHTIFTAHTLMKVIFLPMIVIICETFLHLKFCSSSPALFHLKGHAAEFTHEAQVARHEARCPPNEHKSTSCCSKCPKTRRPQELWLLSAGSRGGSDVTLFIRVQREEVGMDGGGKSHQTETQKTTACFRLLMAASVGLFYGRNHVIIIVPVMTKVP